MYFSIRALIASRISRIELCTELRKRRRSLVWKLLATVMAPSALSSSIAASTSQGTQERAVWASAPDFCDGLPSWFINATRGSQKRNYPDREYADTGGGASVFCGSTRGGGRRGRD